jgi:hypothetical protein
LPGYWAGSHSGIAAAVVAVDEEFDIPHLVRDRLLDDRDVRAIVEGQIGAQAREILRPGLECDDVARRTDQHRSQRRQITDIGPDIDRDVALA